MKLPLSLFFAVGLAGASPLRAEVINLALAGVQAVGSVVTAEKIEGRDAIRVVMDTAVTTDEKPSYARINGRRFHNGTIEVKVFSRLAKDAPEHARGFIGVAFRIHEDDSKFECLYLRPQNAMVEDQVRRNRSTQYISFPDFKFDRLRKEAPGRYESYAPIALDEWIDVRIEVRDSKAKLFVNDQKQPVLIVTDLKHGAGPVGAVGLFVDVGTEGYFSDLKITNDDGTP